MNASAVPQLLTLEEVADLLKVSTKTVKRRIQDGSLVSHKVGHCRRVAATSVMRMFAARSEAAGNAHYMNSVAPKSDSSGGIRYKVNREKGRGFVIRYYAQDGARHSHRIDTQAVAADAPQELADAYAATWVVDHVHPPAEQPRRKTVRHSGPTFGTFATEWFSGALAARYPDHVRKKASASDDEARLKKYVLPLIGNEPLASFEGERGLDLVERVVVALPLTLSASTRRQILQAVRRVLSLAVYPARLLRSQPLPKGFVPSGRCARAKSYLYPREEQILMQWTNAPLVERLFFGLLAREGLRVSEALSLTWRDLDLDVGVLHLDENKTDDARAWSLGPDVVQALLRWKKLQGKNASPTQLVLVDRDGATIEPYEAARSLRAHLSAAGVDRPQLFEESERRIALRAHDLRASFVTVNLALGKTEAWITDRTGHRSSTMIYEYKRSARSHADLNLGAFAPLHEVIPELKDIDPTP